MAFGPQPLMPDQIPTSLPFGGISFTPDVWFKLYYKALTIEAEGIAVLGRIQHPGALAEDNQELTLAEAGWVVASELRLFHDSFFVGFEVGGATGDQANDPGQYLNYRWRFIQQPHGDDAIHDFHFSPDYHVDEIFFRNIMGTVTNATYFKPQAAYWFDLGRTRAIGINGGAIFSMAAGPGLDARRLAPLWRRDRPERRLPQHRRGILRRPHLGCLLAPRRARPPLGDLGPRTPPTPAPPRSFGSTWA